MGKFLRKTQPTLGKSRRAIPRREACHARLGRGLPFALLPPPDSVVVIDAGSTTARFAAALPRDHRLIVITHAVPVAARLAGLPQIELHLLPGKVRPTTHAAVGSETVAALADLRADVAFIATNGLTVGHGLTTPDSDEAASKRAMIACAPLSIAACASCVS